MGEDKQQQFREGSYSKWECGVGEVVQNAPKIIKVNLVFSPQKMLSDSIHCHSMVYMTVLSSSLGTEEESCYLAMPRIPQVQYVPHISHP